MRSLTVLIILTGLFSCTSKEPPDRKLLSGAWRYSHISFEQALKSGEAIQFKNDGTMDMGTLVQKKFYSHEHEKGRWHMKTDVHTLITVDNNGLTNKSYYQFLNPDRLILHDMVRDKDLYLAR